MSLVPKSVERAILRSFVVAAGVAGAALVLFGLAIGDPQTAMRGVGPLVIAAYAAWRRGNDSTSGPVFLLALLVVVVQVGAQGSPGSLTNGAFAILALGLAGTVLTDFRNLPLILTTVGFVSLAFIRSQVVDEPVAELVLFAAVPFLVLFFVTRLIEWAKQEIIGRERSFENLFTHVPVAIWEEDFTRVEQWLAGLRRRGVVDLRGYLAANPNEVRAGASLIEIVDANPEAVRFVEADNRESLLGMLDPESMRDDTLETLAEELVAVWEGRSSLNADLTGSTFRGNPIDGFLMMAAPHSTTGIDWSKTVVAMVDVSQQRATQRRLQELVESKDQFVASVSHELRTPLAAVIGLAQELRIDPNGFSEHERSELVSIIADQANDVGNIVEDLLVAARADIGKVSIHPEPVHLGSEVRATVATIDPDGSYAVDLDSAAVVQADPRRLRQILRNLVSNAHRYGGDAVSISVSAAEGIVHLEVRDDGEGIPDELRDRIFEPYETAHEAVGIAGSVGLGLTVSRQLARLMDGDLTYDHVDGWTVFRLTLPPA